MVELDGDDIRISSRGKVAERDIVQVLTSPMRDLGTPSQTTQQGGGEGASALETSYSPITPGVHWVGLVWRDDKVDWDMGQL